LGESLRVRIYREMKNHTLRASGKAGKPGGAERGPREEEEEEEEEVEKVEKVEETVGFRPQGGNRDDGCWRWIGSL
jgi:hypothetical protein